MKKTLAAILFLFGASAANAGAMFWQTEHLGIYTIQRKGIAPENFNLYDGIEDTLLGECLFFMEITNLVYNDDDDWVGEMLKTCSRPIRETAWNSLKTYYSRPRTGESINFKDA